MKEIRPKINETELGLILKAMETCGWNEFSEEHSSDPRYPLYRRFTELQRGSHVKKRIIGPFAFDLDIRKAWKERRSL